MEFELELRENEGTLTGTLIQEGRASTGGRSEVFAPNSIEWPAEGVEIRTVHLGESETRGTVKRESDGRLVVTATATDAIKNAFREGKRFFSVEFFAVKHHLTKGGVREITQAFVPSVAMVKSPEYAMATAEIREKLNFGTQNPEVDDRKYRIWL